QVQFQGLFQMILVLGIGGKPLLLFKVKIISAVPQKKQERLYHASCHSKINPKSTRDSHFTLNSRVLGLFVCFRKKCQMFTNLIMLVAALLMAFSKTAKSFEMILAGRFLYGVGTGFSLNIHPQYVGEISPKKLRGFTNSTVAVFLTLGKLTGQVVGLREILGSEALWPWLLASSGLSALVQLVTLPFFPDSPPYLLIQKGNEEAFRKGRVSNLPPHSLHLICQSAKKCRSQEIKKRYITPCLVSLTLVVIFL
uniref:Major facilitator superfamily (MFS) profile domain-containing protein n=1 Tax=Anser brachyrhynchus TaxID=132585 RepID=A0A8B9CAT8_9AVES